MIEMVRWFKYMNRQATVYTNGNLLRQQLSQRFLSDGLDHGIRAAGHPASLDAPIQLSSIQTESNRVFGTRNRNAVWGHHKAGIVIVDEIHAAGGPKCQQLLERHAQDDALIVGVTATPIDLQGQWDCLVQAGVNSELRQTSPPLLHYAMHYAIDEPSREMVGRNKIGDYEIAPGKKRKIWQHAVVGSVIENYKRLNPNRLPTVLFGPDVEGAFFFAEEFVKAGIPWAHIDATKVWLNGETLTGVAAEQACEEIIKPGGLLRTGKIAGVSNRFKLREGVDIPEIGCCIAACVFGSLQTYLQAVGRALRYHPSHDQVILIDHGGNDWRHGSVNADRYWTLGQTWKEIRDAREASIRENPESLPITCPKCRMVRASGPRCPGCGFESTGRARVVYQADGTLRKVNDPVLPPKREKATPTIEKLWTSMYFRALKSGMTFNQARALFARENGYQPPDGMRLMPVSPRDWGRRVRDVDRRSLAS